MALTAAGAISLSDVNVELGLSATATIAMNDAAVRTLFDIASGAIAMSDGYGKANTLGYIENVFSTFLYTGDGNAESVTHTNGINLSGSGGLVWIKSRDQTRDHKLVDTVRGAGSGLSTNLTDAAVVPYGFSSFISSGFVVSNNYPAINQTGVSYASWTFRKATKFFDVVTYTGTGSPRTVSHNLGSVPGCIITKRVNSNSNWAVYHKDLTPNGGMYLNFTVGYAADASLFNNTAPTSSVFTVGYDGSTNSPSDTYIAYLFASNAGGYGATGTDNIITCGSFTTDGSGSATVTLGYEPQWILVKATVGNDNWVISDNMRGQATGSNQGIVLNSSGGESGYNTAQQPTHTGFTMAQGFSDRLYIYIAIRRGLMKPVNTSVFKAVTRTASGPPQLISGIGFAPDLAIIKARTVSIEAHWFNRFIGNNKALRSNSQDAEYTANFTLTGATGTVTAGGNSTALNSHGYVDYFFRRATGFFDIVTYTGNGVYGRTITHNLGVTPELIIIKTRNGPDLDWWVNATPFTNWTNAYPTAFLNTTNTITGNGNGGAQNPNATTFGVTSNVNSANASYNLYIAFLFATYPGISKVGSYSGTGALQTVNCGFTSGARFILIKRIDSTGNWYVWDSVRGISSGNDPYSLLNSANSEVGGTDYVDTDSTGFKVTAAAPAELNANGGSYFFFAVA